MKSFRVIRICLLLAAIFGAGVLTGRFTAPQPTPTLVTARGRVHTPLTLAAELAHRVGIDEGQQKKVIPILRRMVREMQPHLPRTQARLDIFLKTMELVRVHIRPEQMGAFQRFVNQQTEHQRRNIRMASPDNSSN